MRTSTMDSGSSLPGSPTPTPTPLQELSDERVNQLRDSSALFSSSRGSTNARDSGVHDKINQFNSLSLQSKALERKTADAALKRAMLGREEAEGEMRRYRDEARALRKQVEEGKERERKVGERLENVMETYGRQQEKHDRAKETHAHTQALWEKEIRRARKETFKSQSVIVKLQEELKSARSCLKTAEENHEREKERSRAREQEAFQARYELVSCQERLEQQAEQLKVLEQERDAFKSLAKSEEDVAKIAAEGLLPLPKSNNPDEDDEFTSPQKKPRVSSAAIVTIKSSAASEAEIEELSRLWQWEKQRADRAAEQVEYLEAECHLRACGCMKKRPRANTTSSPSPSRKRPTLDLGDGADAMILSENSATSAIIKVRANISPKKLNLGAPPKQERRRSTIFVPEEGVFRTVSQEEAEAMAIDSIPADDAAKEPPTPAELATHQHFYSRTPSVDPPAFALLAKERASLISLLDAPQAVETPLNLNIPTISRPAPRLVPAEDVATVEVQENVTMLESRKVTIIPVKHLNATVIPVRDEPDRGRDATPIDLTPRPHTSAAMYSTKTTTTTVPLREENRKPNLSRRILDAQRTPVSTANKSADAPTFDVRDPALTPTMTREQALAQIQARRGRARSAAAGALTPRKQMVQGLERRDVSAPVGRTASAASVRKGPASVGGSLRKGRL